MLMWASIALTPDSCVCGMKKEIDIQHRVYPYSSEPKLQSDCLMML